MEFSQFALAWTMAQPSITSVIIGPRTREQLVDSLGTLDIVVTDEDRERIDTISSPRGTLIDA